MPVIVLTARGQIEDRVVGLDAGAVDYLVKPFSLAELVNVSRTCASVASVKPHSTAAEIEVDPRTPARFVGHVELFWLSTTEFDC